MADYYGTIQGNRGESSRVGSKNSGVRAMVKSWIKRVDMHLNQFDGEDKLTITIPENLNTTINGINYKITAKGLRKVAEKKMEN